jgi:uncharacterized membrane protein
MVRTDSKKWTKFILINVGLLMLIYALLAMAVYDAQSEGLGELGNFWDMMTFTAPE